jgi:hypothetical protein
VSGKLLLKKPDEKKAQSVAGCASFFKCPVMGACAQPPATDASVVFHS